MLTFGVPGWRRAWRWRWSLRLLWGHGEFTDQLCSLWRHAGTSRTHRMFPTKQNKMCVKFQSLFSWKQGEVGLAGDPGELGQLGLKVNCCLVFICLDFLLNSRTKQLFHPRICCLSFCPQGDVGMEGPRGGVGVPGEPVRKHHPHNLIYSNF